FRIRMYVLFRLSENMKIDDTVKNPNAVLRCIPRRCGVRLSTPLSSGIARLASGPFYEVI
ncbi:MAG: hypothetical protein NTZ57_08305, partial [Deltaproteobacteria bacterium]|nr:hypothetical protein [Deltaproteobacteria bacterium]